MTTAIRLLPPSVADAIAAGEVVERPASVVKELCENAIDAGAQRLEVDVEGAGTVRIRVVDDGAGIAADQLRLAVARHATSKIASRDDLAAIRSLGFRGEALASIAAVAELQIVSRPAHATGARLRVRAATVLEEGPVATAPGTTVEVRDLFFNTPARLRFLRSPRAETAALVRAVAELVLTNPAIPVTCRVEGRVALRAPGGTRRDALGAVLGSAAAAELVELEGDGEIAVGGAISQPRSHRATSAGLVLAVNQRRIHHRALMAAVAEAYRGLLPGGRHPYGLVCITIDPAEVDVNVHPSKREVRFRDEGRVFTAVQRACWAALAESRPYLAVIGHPLDKTVTLTTADASPLPWPGTESAPATTGALLGAAGERLPAAAVDAAASAGIESLASLQPLRAMGQVDTRWLVAESPRGVVLVDPHAAHEKVLYAELLAAWGRAGVATGRTAAGGGSQLLLLAALIECDPEQLDRFAAHSDFVTSCGFGLEAFGPGLLRCTAVPAAAASGDVARLVHELLDTLEAGDRPAFDRQHRVAALVACHGAVRFGDPLAIAEQQRLLDRLVATAGGTTCPHGRPTVLVFDDATLRRAFRRPQ
jgi:DNA mismatch repair protein MutL